MLGAPPARGGRPPPITPPICFLPMLGNFACTFALTIFFSSGVPCCDTLASAFLPWLGSGIGYDPDPLPPFPVPLPGKANDFEGSFFLAAIDSRAIFYAAFLCNNLWQMRQSHFTTKGCE
jgi:hypothetical protein